ncbi:histidinol dehydrogenase [Prevotella sp. A2931]|uniref:Histidinol dehydrogenase n=1 Tax=Prevotella illustrans TaxID=2800387 RepID=A0ABS3M2E8_9BACT|nr:MULTISPECIES: histidinol dehydrogenase [Prevotella]MBO1362362.1 histidinol dehydrogenase [Prevotella illustrans]PTL25118.1 histidinol dehydrogenase [Prevotella sp. oral taxon 820]
MNVLKYPAKTEWSQIIQRPHLEVTELKKTVETVLDDVRVNGDEAVFRYEAKFDHATLRSLMVSEEELKEADGMVSKDLKESLLLAHHNISRFHENQRFESKHIETAPGVECWQKSVAIEKVGLYIPGGTAPLFSTVLMLATPAKIAGCKEIILCTPPNHDGKVHPAILAAAKIAGVNKIFKIGGIQAIGAMAYGTQSVPKVYKIFGPGNQYVMAAKQMVGIRDVAIDMPAGPSEVCIVADQSSSPSYIAADLLSQAEHGTDSQVLLICISESIVNRVLREIESQLAVLPRRDIASKALNNSKIILVKDLDEAIELSNMYAPEHLILEVDRWNLMVDKIVNAGSVFLGRWACESAGDYASGTNHTLPTHGYAVAYSGVNLDSYVRKITFQHLTEEGVKSIGQAVVTMAVDEQLEAHANAMRIRLNDIE